ncbi:hydroxymethylglutaryl-CoA lyase [Pseudooceanicola sp. 216_PA32_1]|uniref:Hydroxymethylglutaryl-CoA lyase n=1 Tax=Pseudooceanicola pacificus TaxID=2676438 RepID=A0A844W5Z9_9RHOB|nr:hydroxymethylglutaryl-CoA lyase [Pseudooceanicola pacificus]MWB78154.1 hydroxymethylglutaryl-CoA lyase [Pseudooceanicola pacificus]
MTDLPARIEILEEGPREGFQSEPPGIAVADKIRLIDALADTGLRHVTCASFVNPKVLPQMADAEEIGARLAMREGVEYGALWLSASGFRRAQATPFALRPVVSGSASDTFLLRNNNRTPEAGLHDQREMRALYDAAGLGPGPLYVFTAFGCNFEGDVPVDKVRTTVRNLMEMLAESGQRPTDICLCDTIGAGNPALVRRVVGAVREDWPDVPVALHLHDTRGLGLANAVAGLELGVTRFDSSIGGLGGCPFAGNRAAAGNIATEDLVFLCHEMGIDTGVDLDRAIAAARLAEEIVGHPVPGKVMKAGSLARFRAGATEVTA